MPLLEKKDWFGSDTRFNELYSPYMQSLAARHWTALPVARKAAVFLGSYSDARILDIGSGIGKFCLAAAFYQPQALLFGVEQRKELVAISETAKGLLELANASFIHGNFTQLDFNDYDHFYFYNSFYENLAGTDRIDDSIDYSAELFDYYNRYLHQQLELKPAGTRVVTFHNMGNMIPRRYRLVRSEMNDDLKFWIKM